MSMSASAVQGLLNHHSYEHCQIEGLNDEGNYCGTVRKFQVGKSAQQHLATSYIRKRCSHQPATSLQQPEMDLSLKASSTGPPDVVEC